MRFENLEKLRKAAETSTSSQPHRLRMSQNSQLSTQPISCSQLSQNSQNSRWCTNEGLEIHTWVARTEISSARQRLLSVASQTALKEVTTTEANTERVENFQVYAGTEDLVELHLQASQTDGDFLTEQISDQLARIDGKLDHLLTCSQSQQFPTSSPSPPPPPPPASQGASVYKSLLKRRALTRD